MQKKLQIGDQLLLREVPEYYVVFAVPDHPALFVRSGIFCMWVCPLSNFLKSGSAAFVKFDYLKGIQEEFGTYVSEKTLVTIKGFYPQYGSAIAEKDPRLAKVLPFESPTK